MQPTTKDINQAELVLHSLAQLLALTAMQWIPPQPDDSQANLLYNSTHHRLESRPFALDGQRVRLVLDTTTLALAFTNDQDNPLVSFGPPQQTPNQTQAWWQAQMQAWGVLTFRPVNYRLDQPPVALDTPYPLPAVLPAWNYWRTEANEALRRLNEWSGQASEVRIWPHHFDTGVYYAQLGTDGQEQAASWAGYAIADSLSELPYFYLSGYIRGQSIDFASLPPLSIGVWHISVGWTGALLPVSSVQSLPDIDRFFQESYTHLDNYIQNKGNNGA